MIFFGFIGYTFNKYKIPQSPLILASILGSMMENNWTQSMVFADGSLSVFVTRPLSCALLILSIIFIGMPLVKRFKAPKRQLNFKSYGESFHRLGGGFPFLIGSENCFGRGSACEDQSDGIFCPGLPPRHNYAGGEGASRFQPSVTAAIHEMEKELGVSLILQEEQ